MALDLCYAEDSSARVDLNLVATEQGRVVEIQGTAEGEAVERHEIDQMLDLGLGGIKQLSLLQRAALGEAGVDLERLMR
jgi:ribonuclease PH